MEINEELEQGEKSVLNGLISGLTITEKGGSYMSIVYHKCHFCGGEVFDARITVDYRWGEKLIALIENVPTGICQICGEQYLKAEIVKKMERLAHSKKKPKKMIDVPLIELAVA